MKNKIYYLSIALSLVVIFSSCNYLDITPVGQVIPNKTSEFRGLINTAYKLVPQHKAMLNMRGSQFSPEDDPWGMGLDGFDVYKDIYMWNDQTADNAKTSEYPYMSFYQVIFYTNEIIHNGKNAIDDGTEEIDQIISEAYALRAYMYFELANMYAPVYDKSSASETKGVPVTTEIDIEQVFPKSTLDKVYAHINDDIDNAIKLSKVSQQAGDNRYRFSLESIYALQSRVYLYMKEWQKSIDAAQNALNISSLLEDMNSSTYTSNTNYKSKEAMLSLEHVTVIELRDYASISNELMSSYKDGDLRPGNYFEESWYGYYITSKVASTSERVSFRRSELYLNIAEAAANLDNNAKARSTILDLIKNRYDSEGLSAQTELINGLSGDNLLAEILNEREKELALEGHQWYDWRRTSQPSITKFVKGVECKLEKNDARYTLQFPKSAREANPYLND